MSFSAKAKAHLRASQRFGRPRYRHWLRRLSPRPRRFRAYCVGSPKSGTHSIADLFGKNHHTAHEPQHEETIEMILALANNSVGAEELSAWVRRRDRRLRLEMESSNLVSYFLRPLVEDFPDAKFILTIRDCYSWLDSIINHELSHPQPGAWARVRDLRHAGGGFAHPAEERALAARGLYTLDGYLSFWADYNRRVLAAVPADRLLVVRTSEIADDIERIAEFVGVPAAGLDASGAHSFKAKKKFGLVAQLDRQYLDWKVAAHCADLMSEYFQEIRGAADAPIDTN